MRILRRLVQEQVLHDDTFHRRQRLSDMLRIRVGLHNVLALAIQSLETAVERSLEHVRYAQPRLGIELHAPARLELGSRRCIRDMPVARQLMRE